MENLAMAITRGRAPREEASDGDEMTPAESREAARIQRELLAVLHSDREARTRLSDGSVAARLISAAVPFVVGILIGVLGTLAALVGRISTLEAESRAHSEAISFNAATTSRTLETLTRLDAYVRAGGNQPKP
jgi:hypothetical protein